MRPHRSILVALVHLQLILAASPPSARTKRRDLDPQTCLDNFDVHRDKIIRTEDSREMGAKYINEIDLGSRDECLRLCCETETCDVFVFEEKSPGSCYLFHCGPPEDFKCKFTRHTNFSSAVLAVNRNLAELEDQIKLTKHEQDLASLRNKYQETVTTIKTTTMTPAPTERRTTSAPIQWSRCSRYQYECHSADECIAIYNVCDGIPQCSDGSDEAAQLGCPTVTTPPSAPPQAPNFPPREIVPQLPQRLPAYNPSIPESVSIQKEIQVQHPPPFLSPISSQDGSSWPRRLDQIPQSSMPHAKQYENLASSHIFNHKGGLQVTETDGALPVQYEYKPMAYEPIPDNSWQHRSWQQQDSSNLNDGAALYRMDMEQQNSWKQQQQQQQPFQNLPMQHRIQNVPNQMSPLNGQQEKLSLPPISNMFKDKDKMWAVPQAPQENKPIYPQTEIVTQYEQPKEKPSTVQTTEKPSDETDDGSDDAQNKSKQADDDKSSKKHTVNKSKKKHLKSDQDSNSSKADYETTKAKDEQKSDNTFMTKQFIGDVHDGTAERPPGAILLLSLGVCMTSIMVVLLGCRLKMARRRMRRTGKSPFAHDADYLVNGMYL